ncbi:hypothetical protein CR161_06945 [Prosthecochloris sp. ZM]|uniref:hypothetical protein n=1 Tax=Prosthecochloris sp. ZM TaxID=2283143 RepID=UPI000DF83C77|nr:hypothetical protein [Prosthecochloris sp. ZM]RDD30470.1 hypothetical protein CR161_06945 [Prosthecochloris sp. ZM]
MKYQFIKEHRKEFAVRTMCRVLEISVSSFYEWIQRLKTTLCRVIAAPSARDLLIYGKKW